MSADMCEFKRDKRNKMAQNLVSSSGGTAAVARNARRIVRCSRSSLLVFNGVVCAEEVTRRWLGINSSGPPKGNAWE